MSLSVYSLDNAIETGSEVGKFFRVLNGERGNEEIMRKKRQHFPNLTDNDIITEDYFAAQHLTFIVGVLHQLKELSQCSQQTFNELLNETLKITDRINKVESRTIKCSDCFKKIEEQIEKKSQIFLQGKKAPKIKFAAQQFLFNTSTAPEGLLSTYDSAKAAPIGLQELDPYNELLLPRLDTTEIRSYIQRYTDPFKIYHQWKDSTMKIAEAKKQEERARRQLKKAKKMATPDLDSMEWKARLDKHGFETNAVVPSSPLKEWQQEFQITKSNIQPEMEPQQQENAVHLLSNHKKYVAVYDFTSDDPQELNFVEGDIIWVLQQDGEWWWGEKDGVEGYVPANYLEEAIEDQNTEQEQQIFVSQSIEQQIFVPQSIEQEKSVPQSIEQEKSVPQSTEQQTFVLQNAEQEQQIYVLQNAEQEQQTHVQDQYIEQKLVEEQPIKPETRPIEPVVEPEYVQPKQEIEQPQYIESVLDPPAVVEKSVISSALPPPPPPPPNSIAPKTPIAPKTSIAPKVSISIAPKPSVPDRDDLLSMIRQGVRLRKASERVLDEKKPVPHTNGASAPLNVADILKERFGNELSALNYNSESSESEGSDNEWD